MRTTHRSYSEVSGDFNRLSQFIVAHNCHLRTHSTWSLGRFVDWKYGLYDSKTAIAGFCDKNAQLWFDAFGELAALAISENGGPDFAVLMAEGYRFLYEEILDWVLDHWGERGPSLATEITERQAREIAILERAGFQLESTFYTRRFDLTLERVERFPLEPGFAIAQ